MIFRQRIKDDSITALKEGDKKKVLVLRYLLSLIDKKDLSMPVGELTDEVVMIVLQKELKNKNESKSMFEKGGRSDLVTEVDEEIEILSSYLPAPIDLDMVRGEVIEAVKANGSNFGAVMKQVVGKFKGQVDGTVVSTMVREEIDKMNG